MIFENWLDNRGYNPIETIKNNYIKNRFSEDETQKSIERIIKAYEFWCYQNGLEPTFVNKAYLQQG